MGESRRNGHRQVVFIAVVCEVLGSHRDADRCPAAGLQFGILLFRMASIKEGHIVWSALLKLASSCNARLVSALYASCLLPRQ